MTQNVWLTHSQTDWVRNGSKYVRCFRDEKLEENILSCPVIYSECKRCDDVCAERGGKDKNDYKPKFSESETSSPDVYTEEIQAE